MTNEMLSDQIVILSGAIIVFILLLGCFVLQQTDKILAALIAPPPSEKEGKEPK